MDTSTDIASLIGPVLDPDTPELRAVAINALFGAFGRGGTSGPLGNDTDANLIAGLRDWADVILVGADTVTAEDYGPAQTPMAVLSASLEVDTGLGIFDGARLMVLAPQRSLDDATLLPSRTALERAGAELVSTGGGSLTEAVEALRGLGLQRILLEGGPGVYSAALSEDLVDVLHLTLDPTTSGNDDSHGLDLGGDSVLRFDLDGLGVDADSTLFCRYRRVR